MKILAFLLLFLFASNRQNGADKYLPLADAEKILGQKATLVENKTENRDTVIRYTSVYTTSVNQQVSNLNYLLETYKTAAVSEKMFSTIGAQNRVLSGQQQINDIGDQALFHTDGKNFCILIVRKGNVLIRIKVNKITGKTNIEALKQVARKLAEAL